MAEKPLSPTSSVKKLKFEQLRADYELFLQTFEKPTWLYRLMQRRHYTSPFILYRNLPYLQHNRKKHKQEYQRKDFKIDSLLKKLHPNKEQIIKEESDASDNHLNLVFGGFFHGPGFAEEIFHTADPKIQDLYRDDFVRVKVFLIKLYNKKKKDPDQPMDVVEIGQCLCPWNPRSQLLNHTNTVKVTIPPSAFEETGRVIRTTILSISVHLTIPKKRRKSRKDAKNADGKEPPAKKQRSSRSDTAATATTASKTDDDTSTCENDVFVNKQELILAEYSAELIVFDRFKTHLLTDGEYELLLQPTEDTLKQHGKSNTWEKQFQTKLGPFAAFSFGPTIKFNLCWDVKPCVVAPVYTKLIDAHSNPKAPPPNTANNDAENDTKNIRIIYQFIYNKQTKKQAEAKQGLQCPWCATSSPDLYGLLKHLKLFHLRFNFVYSKVKKGHRIDVSINDRFESQLDFDGIKDIGFIDIDNAPIKRKSATEILTFGRKPLVRDLTEFTEPSVDETKLSAAAHGRFYYHVRNNQQIVDLSKFSCRKEDEIAPDWLTDKTIEMIEEFTDVNSGEKELMKLWNLFVLRKNYVSDASVDNGCVLFVAEYGKTIIEKNLVSNFILHLNNLFDFQVITQSALIKAIQALHKLKDELHVETFVSV